MNKKIKKEEIYHLLVLTILLVVMIVWVEGATFIVFAILVAVDVMYLIFQNTRK